MSYTPTEWDSGDIITAEKLNKIEQGISEASSSGGSDSGVLIVHAGGSLQAPTVDKTYTEIIAAAQAGKVVMLQDPGGYPFGYLQTVNAEACCFVCTDVSPAGTGSATLTAIYVVSDDTVKTKQITLRNDSVS